jgi:hypothetical protein
MDDCHFQLHPKIEKKLKIKKKLKSAVFKSRAQNAL